MIKKKLRSQSGATLVEYSLTVGSLIVVFVAAGIALIAATNKRAAISIEAVSRDIPCVDPVKFPVEKGYPSGNLVWGTSECE